jgi:hypothetical protein
VKKGRLLACALACLASAALAAPIDEDKGKAVAMKLVNDLSVGAYPAADEAFDARAKAALGEPGAAGMWRIVTAKVGPLKQCDMTPRSDLTGDIRYFTFPCEFSAAKLDIRVTVSPEGKVSGFHIAPPPGATPPARAGEAKKD